MKNQPKPKKPLSHAEQSHASADATKVSIKRAKPPRKVLTWNQALDSSLKRKDFATGTMLKQANDDWTREEDVRKKLGPRFNKTVTKINRKKK